MGKIATELDVYNVGKKGVPNQYKGCTKEKVSKFGCTLTKTRNTNLLVEEGTFRKIYTTLYMNVDISYTVTNGITTANITFMLSKTNGSDSTIENPSSFHFDAQFVQNNKVWNLSETFPKGARSISTKKSGVLYGVIMRWNSVSFNPGVIGDYQLSIGSQI